MKMIKNSMGQPDWARTLHSGRLFERKAAWLRELERVESFLDKDYKATTDATLLEITDWGHKLLLTMLDGNAGEKQLERYWIVYHAMLESWKGKNEKTM